MTIQVFIVDDHNLVREGIARLIDSEPDLAVTAQASSVAGGQALVSEGGADVLVVDVTMPDGNGLDLARSARSAHPDMGIVVLTMHNDDETLLEALDAGASALVLKSSSADDVLDAIRHSANAPDAFTATGLGAALRRRDTLSAAKPILTPRETEVLMRLVDGDSVATVAKELYMSESTVKTHVARVYEKLGAHNRASATMAAVRLGFVKPDVDSSKPTTAG
ncbi:MAG TPA: response regulator transcription factor [Dermatophilaceae bacterium]|nr:response regulator transcription factor [Dermatophilaceae bacterium]